MTISDGGACELREQILARHAGRESRPEAIDGRSVNEGDEVQLIHIARPNVTSDEKADDHLTLAGKRALGRERAFQFCFIEAQRS